MRRIESAQVPNETRRMLRERFQRFLPGNLLTGDYTNLPVIPKISDKEVVDLFLSLVFVPSDDLARARDLFENQSTAPINMESSETGPDSAGASGLPSPTAAGTTIEQSPFAQVAARISSSAINNGSAPDTSADTASDVNANEQLSTTLS